MTAVLKHFPGQKVKRKLNMFGARRTTIDGITYASAREAKICNEFRMLERAGHIKDLVLQPKFSIHVNGCLIRKFTADASYFDLREGDDYGPHLVDVKSPATAALQDFKHVKKLMWAVHGINVEVKF